MRAQRKQGAERNGNGFGHQTSLRRGYRRPMRNGRRDGDTTFALLENILSKTARVSHRRLFLDS